MLRDRRLFFLAALLLIPAAGCSSNPTNTPKPSVKGQVHKVAAGANAQDEVLKILNDKLQPGDILEFGEGTFEFTQELTLRTEHATLRGKGMDKTILSFKNQNQGKQGILVNRDYFLIENLTVEDTKGDAIKIEGAKHVVFHKVRARWNGEPKASNGAYGLYPVQCEHVLIEDCEAYGASDAGIYVGQSKNIIVRRCKAERNVAGIEIENSTDADVYENTATNNTGGLLVFDLPDLPVKNGKRIRVFNNKVFGNNHANFATPGTIVATVSPGTGMLVLCTDQVEVFKNDIKDNQTFNFAVVSYHITGRDYKDKEFDPIPEGIYVHDNTFATGGTKPTGERGLAFAALLGTPIPDIIWDGVVNPAKLADGKVPQSLGVYFKNNGEATFANLNWDVLRPELAAAKSQGEKLPKILAHKKHVIRDIKPFEGELQPLPEVKLP